MCGRYSLTVTSEALIEHFHLKNGLFMVPRYNVAPTQTVPVIKFPGQLDFLQWGLMPAWMSEKVSKPFINARSETVSQKPSFKTAFNKRRCLVAANGYYEWKLLGKIKQPYYIHYKDSRIFAFAGIWEDDTFSILTAAATPTLTELHPRMPIILPPAAYQTWLNPKSKIKEEIEPLLGSAADLPLEFYPVATLVNNPAFEGQACIRSLLL